MKLKNILIVVRDIEKSKKFYHDLFGLDMILDNDGNVILTEGLVLQDEKIWRKFINEDIILENNSFKLYFEENDIDGFVAKLEALYPDVKYANKLMTHTWGQRVVRFYDLDGNLIEVGTPMLFLQENQKEDYIKNKKKRDRISKLAKEFRDAIVEAKELGKFSEYPPFNKFPCDCCDDTCDLLSQYLFENGINTTKIKGRHRIDYQQYHVWLVDDNGTIIDITEMQFESKLVPKGTAKMVRVGEEEGTIQKMFCVNRTTEKRVIFNEPSLYEGFGGTPSRAQTFLNELYGIIIDHI